MASCVSRSENLARRLRLHSALHYLNDGPSPKNPITPFNPQAYNETANLQISPGYDPPRLSQAENQIAAVANTHHEFCGLVPPCQ